jgi:hypothetical protein
MKRRKILFWILAVVISLGTMYYQRKTGPSYPKKFEVVEQGVRHTFTLPRSNQGRAGDYPVKVELPDAFTGTLSWRLFPSDGPWEPVTMAREGEFLTAPIPEQPPAGKVEYRVELAYDGKPVMSDEAFTVVFRYRGDVPAWALIPHILMMILTVIWSTATILFVAVKLPYKRLIGTTIIFLIVGGFILGPIVQKFSFGQYWTGWPLGEDLTDNKVLAALVVYLVAWFLREKSYGKWLAVAAALVMLAVYLIPHSLRGSELDLETGEVVTGSIALLFTRFIHSKSRSSYAKIPV